jgi:hypothetical protein
MKLCGMHEKFEKINFVKKMMIINDNKTIIYVALRCIKRNIKKSTVISTKKKYNEKYNENYNKWYECL